ncbi:hypothetical protein CTA2_1500 [Colletotrichum tanaceti]|uniref:Ankyrin repeat protein n=1 Tax=Colletotrichum tanaceti TaxID=1306861 RepID=A0A4U6X6B5_9PEZI|nr:hypothetical protein CTA2_1500 [Colletotrichum tanaceti]TKW50624.1 hypothetical protein CTA1_1345 [Colletotrichum tanaceti]
MTGVWNGGRPLYAYFIIHVPFHTSGILPCPTSLPRASIQSRFPSFSIHTHTHTSSGGVVQHMSRFFRPDGESSDDDDENPATLSERSSSPDPTSTRPQPSRKSTSGSLSDSDPDSDSEPQPFLLECPTLPVSISLISTIRGRWSGRPATPPDPLPAPLVQDILQSVPSLDMETEEDLEQKFTDRRYNCDVIGIWLQAVDPETGDSLVHAIVRSGRIRAFGACQLLPTCGNGTGRFHGHLERHIMFMHQNREGDNGLHVAARTGGLPLVRAVLRAFRGMDTHDGAPTPGEFGRHELPGAQGGGVSSCQAKRILFMEARNVAGRTAAEEARHHGHGEVAGFLERVLDNSYPPDCGDRESMRQQARSVWGY